MQMKIYQAWWKGKQCCVKHQKDSNCLETNPASGTIKEDVEHSEFERLDDDDGNDDVDDNDIYFFLHCLELN